MKVRAPHKDLEVLGLCVALERIAAVTYSIEQHRSERVRIDADVDLTTAQLSLSSDFAAPS
jgi:hypothetical protein